MKASNLPEMHSEVIKIKILRALRTVAVSVDPVDKAPREWEAYESEVTGVFTRLDYDTLAEGLRSLRFEDSEVDKLLNTLRTYRK